MRDPVVVVVVNSAARRRRQLKGMVVGMLVDRRHAETQQRFRRHPAPVYRPPPRAQRVRPALLCNRGWQNGGIAGDEKIRFRTTGAVSPASL